MGRRRACWPASSRNESHEFIGQPAEFASRPEHAAGAFTPPGYWESRRLGAARCFSGQCFPGRCFPRQRLGRAANRRADAEGPWTQAAHATAQSGARCSHALRRGPAGTGGTASRLHGRTQRAPQAGHHSARGQLAFDARTGSAAGATGRHVAVTGQGQRNASAAAQRLGGSKPAGRKSTEWKCAGGATPVSAGAATGPRGGLQDASAGRRTIRQAAAEQSGSASAAGLPAAATGATAVAGAASGRQDGWSAAHAGSCLARGFAADAGSAAAKAALATANDPAAGGALAARTAADHTAAAGVAPFGQERTEIRRRRIASAQHRRRSRSVAATTVGSRAARLIA